MNLLTLTPTLHPARKTVVSLLTALAAIVLPPVGFCEATRSLPAPGASAPGVVTRLSNVNLIPYTPGGWSAPIVISNTTGTTTDTVNLRATDTLYLDFAVLNTGPGDINVVFYHEIYVDGVLRTTKHTNPPLYSNYYTYVTDHNLGTLSPGTHTIRLVTDSGLNVGETSGADNEYVKTITVASDSNPNLTPYLPAGWSDRMVISKETGTNADSSGITPTDAVYLDYSVINDGTAATANGFELQVYVDGALFQTRVQNNLINPNSYYRTQDLNLGTFASGTHTVEVVIDSNGAITESNEGDNYYSKTFVVTSAPKPNLTNYVPPGWDDVIILSTSTGTNTNAGIAEPSQHIYLDYAVLNNGPGATSSSFKQEVYIDGSLFQTRVFSGTLNSNYYYTTQDLDLGILATGGHYVEVYIDALDSILETDETDNYLGAYIEVLPAGPPNLVNYKPSGWSSPIVISSRRGTVVDSILNVGEELYINYAVLNGGGSPTAAEFDLEVYIDGVLFQTRTRTTPLTNGFFYRTVDLPIGTLAPGAHSVELVIDTGNSIGESDEEDNRFTKNFNIVEPVPFDEYSGDYAGVASSEPVTAETSGAVTLRLMRNGRFTASMILQGHRYRLKGSLAASGTYTRALAIGERKGRKLTADLAVDPSEGGKLIGAFPDLDPIPAIYAERNPNTGRGSSEAAGRHTFFTTPSIGFKDETRFPQGASFGAINVKRSGRLRAAMMLADGTKGSLGSALGASKRMPFYNAIYRKRGAIVGWVPVVGNSSGVQTPGLVTWVKPGGSGPILPAGFVVRNDAQTSPYFRPRRGERIINVAPSEQNCLFGYSGGGVTTLASTFFTTLDSRNKMRGAGYDGLQMRIKERGGTFSGEFRDLETGSKRKFAGAFLQNRNQGIGYFAGEGQSGSITIDSTGAFTPIKRPRGSAEED